MLLTWSSFLKETRKVPGGVAKPLRPWLIGTGPATTLPPRSSHAWFVDSRTHARTAVEHGTLGEAAVGTGAAVAAVAVPNRAATTVIVSTSARRMVTVSWSRKQPCSVAPHGVPSRTGLSVS